MLGSGPWQLGEMGQKYMKTIKTSSLHLSALINDILDAAAATKGKLAIKLEKVWWLLAGNSSIILRRGRFCTMDMFERLDVRGKIKGGGKLL